MGKVASMGGVSNRMGDFSMDFPAVNTSMTCFVLPPRSNSNGVLGSLSEPTRFLTYSMPRFELQMGIILTVSHAIHFLLKPFGISAFVSCILTGIILGPSVLGKFDFMREVIFPHDSQDIIYTAVMLGYNIYMFLSTVKMEVGMVFKIGRKALLIGLTSAVIPYMFFSVYLGFQQQNLEKLSPQNPAIVKILVITSLPVVAYVIDQLKLTNTELGRLALASGLVADFSGVSMYIIRVLRLTRSVDDAMRFILPLLIYVLTLAFIFRPAMNWVIRNTPNRKPLSTSFIYVIMALAIGSEAVFFAIGQSQYLAPFLFGLFVPSGAPLGSALVEKFGSFTNGVLINILVTTAFMRTDLHLVITNFVSLERYMGIILLAFAVKMSACVVPSMILKMPIKEAVAIAFILNYNGVIQLSLSVLYRDVLAFREDVYALVALYILLNATIFPVIIKKLYCPLKKFEGYRSKNFLNMKHCTELKILTCIYGQDNVESYIKLLHTIRPTKENPIAIYALHLVELIGRYLPMMVSHSKNKQISTTTSQNMIYAFNKYEQSNWDSVSIQLFTGFSSFPLMHEDILNIALEKKTSLIILPLHRRWSIHGNMEPQDKRWRSVNCNILEKAPCSVGIFFSRGSLRRRRSSRANSLNLSVCMIFFGGSDDRGALILAKRMVKDSETRLTVVHFQPEEYEDIDEEEHMYDVVLIEDIKQMAATNEYLDYRGHVVQDGQETVKIVRSMANQFDLFIVGRRFGVPTPQTLGLSQWSELPELGIIGDLFASNDLETKASVLVMQQQKQIRQLTK